MGKYKVKCANTPYLFDTWEAAAEFAQLALHHVRDKYYKPAEVSIALAEEEDEEDE